MHDCRVKLILIKFKSLIIVLFNFRKARHSISTVFPGNFEANMHASVARLAGSQFVKTLVIYTWCLGIYSVLKFHPMFSFKLTFATATMYSPVIEQTC